MAGQSEAQLPGPGPQPPSTGETEDTHRGQTAQSLAPASHRQVRASDTWNWRTETGRAGLELTLSRAFPKPDSVLISTSMDHTFNSHNHPAGGL